METTDKNKIYPSGITNYMLLCILALLYLYLGLLVIPLLTIMGQFFFIYTSRQWRKRYGGKRNFDMSHSLYHLGHPRWITDIGMILFVSGFYLAPVIMLVQSFWLDRSNLIHDIGWWITNLYTVIYYILLIRNCIKNTVK